MITDSFDHFVSLGLPPLLLLSFFPFLTEAAAGIKNGAGLSVGVTTGAIVVVATGTIVVVTGAPLTGAGVNMHPHASPTTDGMLSQKVGGSKPTSPDVAKSLQLTGPSCSLNCRSAPGLVTIPPEHISHGGKTGAEVVGVVGVTGEGVTGVTGAAVSVHPHASKMLAGNSVQTSAGSSIDAPASSRRPQLSTTSPNCRFTSGRVTEKPSPQTTHAGLPRPEGAGVGGGVAGITGAGVGGGVAGVTGAGVGGGVAGVTGAGVGGGVGGDVGGDVGGGVAGTGAGVIGAGPQLHEAAWSVRKPQKAASTNPSSAD